MVVKVKIYEFDTVKELKEFEGKDVVEQKSEATLEELQAEQRKEFERLLKEEKELKFEKIDSRKAKFNNSKTNFRKIWRKSDNNLLLKLAKENAMNGVERVDAIRNIAEIMGRSESSIMTRLHKNKFLYMKDYRDEKKKESDDVSSKLIGKGRNSKWTEEQDKYLIDTVNRDLSTGRKRLDISTYDKLSKDLKRTVFGLKKRVELLRREGKIRIPKRNITTKTTKTTKTTRPVVKTTGKFKRWTKEEDKYLIDTIKKELDNGNGKRWKVRRKTYYKLAQRLNKKISGIQARVHKFKQEGLIPKKMPKEIKEKTTVGLRKINEERKIKIKPDASKYMMKKKATVPKEEFKGKITEYKPFFSKKLDSNQNELLKAMIKNDIINHGISKINREKLDMISNIDSDDYDQILADVLNNTNTIKSNLKISVISLSKVGSDRFLIFS